MSTLVSTRLLLHLSKQYIKSPHDFLSIWPYTLLIFSLCGLHTLLNFFLHSLSWDCKVTVCLNFVISCCDCCIDLEHGDPNVLDGVEPIPNPLTLPCLSGPKILDTISFRPVLDDTESILSSSYPLIFACNKFAMQV